ncbi:unnamed protein product [Lactuca virosa]|uniref:Uncharacterized protein n=1 Tax=Lactuca virosa TaxID=75947 RepID=A0AAU9MU41_9ASTR|nr:unnamed protein product [Lactuca virosa]
MSTGKKRTTTGETAATMNRSRRLVGAMGIDQGSGRHLNRDLFFLSNGSCYCVYFLFHVSYSLTDKYAPLKMEECQETTNTKITKERRVSGQYMPSGREREPHQSIAVLDDYVEVLLN